MVPEKKRAPPPRKRNVGGTGAKRKANHQDREADSVGTRRSRRLLSKSEDNVIIKNEDDYEDLDARDAFDKILGEFIIDGRCPKCHKIYQKGHKRHLDTCKGSQEPTSRSGIDKKVLNGLSEEDRKNERKKMLARMSALSIDGLDEFHDDFATIGVIGSTGRRYIVTFQDSKGSFEYKDFPRKCQCIDSRCRRRDCKHICLVMHHLGIDLDISPDEFNSVWRQSIEDNIKELLKGEDDIDVPVTIPEGKNASIGRKFLED